MKLEWGLLVGPISPISALVLSHSFKYPDHDLGLQGHRRALNVR